MPGPTVLQVSGTQVWHISAMEEFDWMELPWMACGFELGLLTAGKHFLQAFPPPCVCHRDPPGGEQGSLATEQGVSWLWLRACLFLSTAITITTFLLPAFPQSTSPPLASPVPKGIHVSS